MAESGKVRYVYSREILLNKETIREVNSTEIESSYKQPNKPPISKHSIEFIYSDFPCHFKVNRDKLRLY